MTKSHSKFSDSHFKKFSLQLIFVILACIVSYYWIDRPLAAFLTHINRFSAGNLGNYNITNNLTTVAYGLTLLLMAFYAYMRLINHESNRFIAMAGGISFAVPIAFFVKTELQYILGRMPVRDGGSNSLLFLRLPKAYGFHLFSGQGSFPSGHMCVFTACLLMISFYYPKLKTYVLIALSLLGIILIFDNYHFLSDVIAGTYLGFLIAKITYKLEPTTVH